MQRSEQIPGPAVGFRTFCAYLLCPYVASLLSTHLQKPCDDNQEKSATCASAHDWHTEQPGELVHAAGSGDPFGHGDQRQYLDGTNDPNGVRTSGELSLVTFMAIYWVWLHGSTCVWAAQPEPKTFAIRGIASPWICWL